MKTNPNRRSSRRAWRAFSPRDGRAIEALVRDGLSPLCPCCGDHLEAEPQTRLARDLPLDARGYDLCCRGCRRFWCLVRHTERSLRLIRMRRLVAAIRAVQPDSTPRRRAAVAMAAPAGAA